MTITRKADLGYRLFSPVRAVMELINRRNYREMVLRGLLPLVVDGASVLDVGCDDGGLSREMMRRNSTLKVTGVDVQILHPACIPKVIYDGRCLPFPTASFDVAMAVDVLHHTPDAQEVVREMARVSRRYVLIKDLVWHGNLIGWYLLYLSEWCSNTPFGIGRAYNFQHLEDWLAIFEHLDLKIEATAQISHFPFRANEKFNWIFLLEKNSPQRH